MKPIYERAFVLLSGVTAEPTERGRRQFHRHQSLGIRPRAPDPYYHVLCQGKRWLDFLASEYRRMWLKGEWWGFRQLWHDWTGNRWILPLLCKWWRGDLPEWLTEEDEPSASEP